MKIRDQDLWQSQKQEIAQSDEKEIGVLFLQFVEDWCESAEALMETEPLVGHNLRPIDALRRTLQPTESRLGVLPPGWTSQMLLVIAANWGKIPAEDEFFESMTPIERHAIGDAATLIQARIDETV